MLDYLLVARQAPLTDRNTIRFSEKAAKPALWNSRLRTHLRGTCSITYPTRNQITRVCFIQQRRRTKQSSPQSQPKRGTAPRGTDGSQVEIGADQLAVISSEIAVASFEISISSED